MKHLYLVFALLFISATFCVAQEEQEESPFNIGADLMSRYIWRGLDLGGSSSSIQPTFEFTAGDSTHSFTIGTWGAYSVANSYQEVDLYLKYTINDMISVSITDYFLPEYYGDIRDNFFEFGKDSTGHLLEGAVSFDGTEKIPFTLLFAMNVYGNDTRKIKDDGTDGGIFMSKYVEIGYAHTFNGVDINPFLGIALDKPNEDRGEVSYYGNKKVGIINVGIKASKSIKITDKFELPVQSSLIINPNAKKIFLTFGISF